MINLGNFSRIQFVRQKEFKNILAKIVMCYEILCDDYTVNKKYLPNNENQIRDILHYEYLNCKHIRTKVRLSQYLFIPEVPESETKDNKRGRTDLRVIIKSRTFDNPQEYFTIECKRIDGNELLNKAYITNGIQRFVNSVPLYSSCYSTNGMLGFVVKKIDIDNNVSTINDLLLNKYETINTIGRILREDTVLCCYKSLHTSKGEPLQLYHLMLDFSPLVL